MSGKPTWGEERHGAKSEGDRLAHYWLAQSCVPRLSIEAVTNNVKCLRYEMNRSVSSLHRFNVFVLVQLQILHCWEFPPILHSPTSKAARL